MARVLDDLVLVVTGASSGIGRATAIEAARAGMDLVLSARREGRLEEVAAEIRRIGRRAHTVVGDVAEPGFSRRLLEESTRVFGRYDVVFANAGYGAERRFLEFDEEELRRIFEVNFFASTELLREAALGLKARGHGGHLLMCSSCVARFTLPGYGPYSATKAAQLMVARAMRYELKKHGIQVSTVHPVTTTTEFFEVAGAGGAGDDGVADHAPGFIVQPPERVARAVVRCLRSPRPEVWTSLSAHFAAGLFTLFPRVADFFLAPHIRHLPPEK